MHSPQLSNYYEKCKREYPKTAIACKWIGIAGCLLAMRHLYHVCCSKYYKFAPGPKGVPLFGCLFQFIFRQKEFLSNLSKYGPVVSVPLGMQMVTIINEQTAWNDMLRHSSFASTLRPLPLEPWAVHPCVAYIDGDHFKERLALMLKSCTDITKTQFIAKRTEISLYENNTFAKLDSLCSSNAKWYPLTDLNIIAFNNLFAFCFGVNLQQNDAFFVEFLNANQKRMDNSKWLQFHMFTHGLALFQYRRVNELQQVSSEQAKLLADWMIANGGFEYDAKSGEFVRAKHHPLNWKRNKVRKEKIVHFVDLVIKHNLTSKQQQKKQKNRSSSQTERTPAIQLDTLIKDIISILSHGYMSTANALEYALVSLAKFPKIQERIYAELKQVIIIHHQKLQFTLDMVSECHLLRAFVAEILRIASVVPLGMLCRNESGAEYVDPVRGHVVPNNGWVMPNFHGMNVKENRCEFDIHRWLDETGKFKQDNISLPFGSAHRKCIGQNIAMQTIYSVISMFLMRYRISTENPETQHFPIKQEWGWNQTVSPKIGIMLKRRQSVIHLYDELNGEVLKRSVSLKNGNYFIYTFRGFTEQQLLWDVAANFKRNNGVIHQWKYHGGRNQQFYVELADENSGLYTIQSVHSGLYAQMKYESRYEFVELVQYERQTQADDKTQKFILIAVDEAEQIYQIVNANSLMALGVQNQSQQLHSKLMQHSRSQHDSQLFKFVPVCG